MYSLIVKVLVSSHFLSSELEPKIYSLNNSRVIKRKYFKSLTSQRTCAGKKIGIIGYYVLLAEHILIKVKLLLVT